MQFTKLTSRTIVLSVPVLLLALVAPHGAGQKRDRFAKQIRIADRTLERNGVGLCEWGFFAVDLYYCALYLERNTSRPDRVIRSRQAKRLHLRFVRSLTRSQLQEAYTAAVKYNAGKSIRQFKKRLDQLTAMMEDVDDGESLIFDYLPEKGITVSFEKKANASGKMTRRVKGVIKGDDFARLFFILYFGAHPPDRNLKTGMLGKHPESRHSDPRSGRSERTAGDSNQ